MKKEQSKKQSRNQESTEVLSAANMVRPSELAEKVLTMCKKRNWSLHWTHRGAYLHLESSELIEAVRGKTGQPLKEAADVLIVLMSITEANEIPFEAVMRKADNICDDLMKRPKYEFEVTKDEPV